MEQDDVVLKATGLTVGYARRTVLDRVTVECRKGEFWFFIGPNGSGKTTLIRAILGIVRPWDGQLWLHLISLDGKGSDLFRSGAI
ncbi:MAG: ATP-binding cassette domain-containing protein [Candidatus Methylomirabilis sp.]|nr:ATP-binding cassette domain-containing protein [Candidatus Methylomirabilis sp.]